jgi:hypothetical protein
MSRSVWKYEVPVDDQWHEVLIPQPGRVLHVDSQGARTTVAVWAEVTPSSDELYPQRFRAFGTGQPIPARSNYVGSTLAGPFVWHIYAETPGLFGKYGDES